MSVTTMLAVVACVAVNLWLFRLGALWGILGLNVTKHVVIAALCQNLGVDQAPATEVLASPGLATPEPAIPQAQPVPPG